MTNHRSADQLSSAVCQKWTWELPFVTIAWHLPCLLIPHCWTLITTSGKSSKTSVTVVFSAKWRPNAWWQLNLSITLVCYSCFFSLFKHLSPLSEHNNPLISHGIPRIRFSKTLFSPPGASCLSLFSDVNTQRGDSEALKPIQTVLREHITQ